MSTVVDVQQIWNFNELKTKLLITNKLFYSYWTRQKSSNQESKHDKKITGSTYKYNVVFRFNSLVSRHTTHKTKSRKQTMNKSRIHKYTNATRIPNNIFNEWKPSVLYIWQKRKLVILTRANATNFNKITLSKNLL